MASCPDESDVLDLVEGRLPPAEDARVRDHVDTCSACRELVANLLSVDDSVQTSEDPDLLLRGTTIGRYTVLAREGAGGMGAVYSAYDPELDRKIAIKLVRTDLLSRGDPDALRARMIGEARAMARLQHPNVVAVYDVGTLGEEIFIAMEFVEGSTLGQWRAAEPRTWREILAKYLLAGEGLAAAHRVGLVHRDFKPDNVLVGTDRERGERVCVGDFGLVRMQTTTEVVARSEEHGDPRSTVTLVGTPRYMAPEQRAGERVDARADQFAFCRALEEALFELGDTGAPASLRSPLARGQADDPDARFPAMDELVARLRRHVTGTRRGRVETSVAVAVAMLGIVIWQLRGVQEPACIDAAVGLASVWDDDVRARVRGAFEASDRPHALDTHARVELTLDDYAGRWVEQRRDACEATYVRGEQSQDLFDMRMICLDRARSSLRALTELLVDPQTTDVDRAQLTAKSLPHVDACADVEALRAAVPVPDDPSERESIEWIGAELDRVRLRNYMLGASSAASERLQELVGEADRTGYAPLRHRALMLLSDVQ